MRTTLRVARVLLALAAIYAAGAGGVRAASPQPDLIGGALSATPGAVTLTSQSTIPVAVSMTADGPFTLEPSAFSLDPGETVTMAVRGDAAGRVSADLSVLEPAAAGESSSVTLQVAFPRERPFNWLVLIPVGLAVVVGLGGIHLGLRASRRYTIVRREP